jgi:hypothetical protein
MNYFNIGTQEAPKWLFTTQINVNGEVQEIVPAFTIYSINRKNYEKNKIHKELNKSQILPTVFCFTDAETFTKEGIQLFDYDGKLIENIPEESPKIMVYLDKVDNINLFDLFESPLPATIVECKSVSDAYQKVATSAFLSQCPSKDEWTGLAAAVSEDVTLKDIREFSIKYSMGGTTAQGYFGINTNTALMQSKAVSVGSKPLTARTKDQAENLLKATVDAFGVRNAKQTRYIKAVNYCINQYGYEIVLEALNNISASDKLQLDAESCDDKVACLQTLIIEQVLKLKEVRSVA